MNSSRDRQTDRLVEPVQRIAAPPKMNVLMAADTASLDTWSEGSCSGSRSDYRLSYVSQLSSVSSTNTATVLTLSSIFPTPKNQVLFIIFLTSYSTPYKLHSSR